MNTSRRSSLLTLALALPGFAGCHSDVLDSAEDPAVISLAATAAGKAGLTPAKGKGGASGAGGSAGAGPAVPPALVPTATITQPKLGEPLYDGSPRFADTSWYNPGNTSIIVKGGFGGLPSNLNPNKLAVLVNATSMAFTYNAAAGTVQFEDAMPAVFDPEWVHRLLRAELVNTETGRVLARDYSWYFDLRYAGDATVTEPNDSRVAGMAAQITDTGIGANVEDPARLSALEVPHLSTLPHPALASFNKDLTGGAKRLDKEELGDLKACQSLSEAEEATGTSLRTAPAYLEAYAQALGYYAAYKAWENGGEEACVTALAAAAPASFILGLAVQAGCASVMSNWCVTEQPKAEDFDFCVGRLDGEATALDISAVSDVDLSFMQSPAGQNGADLSADLTVSGVSGKLDILLRDLSIGWSDQSCTARPKATMADNAIPESLEDFTTCKGVTVDAATATTGDRPANLRIERDESIAGELERLNVVQTRAPKFSLVDPEVDSTKGACELDFISAHAEALAGRFPGRFEGVLTDTWSAGAREPLQADALELLVDRLELGVLEHDDFVLDAAHEPLSSLPRGGAKLTLETLLQPGQDSSAWSRMRSGWFHHPPPDTLSPYSELGTMPEDATGTEDPFDLSFTLTTGFLNQILHVRGATERLYFEYAPTKFQLLGMGITPPASWPENVPVPLNGSVLGQLHPMFSELGSTAVSITISPTLDPIVYMNPDAASAPDGAPLAFGASGLEIRFTSLSGTSGSVPGVEWLRAVLYFVDKDFQISFDQQSPRFLEVDYGQDEFSVVIEQNAFSTCRMDVHGSLEPPNSCERALEITLTAMFETLLKPRFRAMLSDLDAPQVWDAAGEATQVRVSTLRHHNEGQYIKLFATIPTES
jgi:hypothetical protein